jgi:hypothetical protein
VVPIRAGLVRHGELVREGVARRDGALGYERRAVGPGRVGLEQAVPVLMGAELVLGVLGERREANDGGAG